MLIFIYTFTLNFFIAIAIPMQKQLQRSGTSAGCISKYFNKDLGPLEILMMPLGEKLWLRAWLGMHMSNLLHMEGVDLSEVSQSETDRLKRSFSHVQDSENERIVYENDVEPNSYNLTVQVQLPMETESYIYNELQINITCLFSCNYVILHANNDMRVKEITIRVLNSINISNKDFLHSEQEHKQEQMEISKIIWNQKESSYVIFVQENLVEGVQYQIHVKYHLPIHKKTEGIIFYQYLPGGTEEISWYLGFGLKNGNILNVIPSLRGMRQKTTFEINVIHPLGTATIASSPFNFLEQMSNLPGLVRSHFKTTPPTISSSISIFIYNPLHFDQLSQNTDSGVTIRGFVQNFDKAQIQNIIDYVASEISFLENHLGVPFPTRHLHILFLPNKHQPIEDYRGMIIASIDVSTSKLLFHLLKQWFGHFVTAQDLNEEYVTQSLANYYTYFCSPYTRNECETASLLSNFNTDFLTLLEMKENMKVQEFKEHKMVLFLHMLSSSLSENSFQRGIQVFLKYRSYSTFVLEDLWDSLDIQAWSDGTLDRAMSTKDISVVWLSQDKLPLVTISFDHKNRTIIIKQEVFKRHWPYSVRGQDDILWQIPIPFVTQNDLMDRRSGTIYWLKEKESIVEENMDSFSDYFIGNYGNIGMYIVNYNYSNWKALSENLLAEGMRDYFLIPSKTRASLVRNAWYLATSGHLNFTLALNMSLFLKYEADPSVWKTFAEVYFMVAWKLIGTGIEVKYDRFIGDLLIPIYEKSHLDPGNNDTAEIKALVYYVLCMAGYEPVIMNARSDFDQWLISHEEINHGIIGGVVRWIDEDWERGLHHVLHLLKEGKSPKIRTFLLSKLAGTSNYDKTERLMSVLLTDHNYAFSKSEVMNALHAISSCKTYLNFLTSEWNTLKERYASEPNMWQFILEQAAKKCKTPDGIKWVEEFYKIHHNDLGTSGNSLKYNIQISRRDMEVVYYQIPEFEEALDQYLD